MNLSPLENTSLLAGGEFKRVILTLNCTFVCAAAAPRSHWHPRDRMYVMYVWWGRCFCMCDVSERLCGHDATMHPVTVLPRWQHCTSPLSSVQELNADVKTRSCVSSCNGGGDDYLESSVKIWTRLTGVVNRISGWMTGSYMNEHFSNTRASTGQPLLHKDEERGRAQGFKRRW